MWLLFPGKTGLVLIGEHQLYALCLRVLLMVDGKVECCDGYTKTHVEGKVMLATYT